MARENGSTKMAPTTTAYMKKTSHVAEEFTNGTMVKVWTKVKAEADFGLYASLDGSKLPFLVVEGMSHLQIEISDKPDTAIKVWKESL